MKNYLILLLITISLFSCKDDEVIVYDEVPLIEFISVENKFEPYGETRGFDTVAITISYEDGAPNGGNDLGLGFSEEWLEPPYNPTNPDGSPNKFADNYWLTFYRLENGVFKEVEWPDGIRFYYRFLQLGKDGFVTPGSIYNDGDIIEAV